MALTLLRAPALRNDNTRSRGTRKKVSDPSTQSLSSSDD